jgi:hypothetical protein
MFSLNNGLGPVLETVVVVYTTIFFRSWPEAVRKIKKMFKKKQTVSGKNRNVIPT